MIDPDLARLDAVGQAELVARGVLSPAEALAAWRARHEALGPLLRAVVATTDETPRAPSGPLAGVPFLVKDSLPWPGMRWAMGSRALSRASAPPPPPLVRALARTGLVGVGKTATSELGLLASTETLLEGATHNPWDLSLSAGGSSGGSAAAVAAGLVPIAHASDGGGSIRIPASFCGVFGFTPSRGRTPPASLGSTVFEEMTSEHCITRSVRDAALFLSLVEESAGGERVGHVREPIRRSLRVAMLTTGVDGVEAAPAVVDAVTRTASLLTELGHHVEPITLPFDAARLERAFFVVMGAAVSRLVAQLDAARGTPVQEDELEPFTWSLFDALEAEGEGALDAARSSFADAVRTYRAGTRDFDVVLTPTVSSEPWRLGHLSPLVAPAELRRRIARGNTFAPLANLTGGPAMSVPLDRAPSGAPLGAHFMAAPGADALLLGLAYQLEAARPWKDTWPPFSIPALAAARRR